MPPMQHASVLSPEALGEEQARGNRPASDQRQQPAGECGMVVQVPHILPDEDGCTGHKEGAALSFSERVLALGTERSQARCCSGSSQSREAGAGVRHQGRCYQRLVAMRAPVNSPTTNQGPCSSASCLGLQATGQKGSRSPPGAARRWAGQGPAGGELGGAPRLVAGHPRATSQHAGGSGPHHFMNLTSGSSLARHDCTTSPVTWRSRRSMRRVGAWRQIGAGACWQASSRGARVAGLPALSAPLPHHEGTDGAPPAAQQRVQHCKGVRQDRRKRAGRQCQAAAARSTSQGLASWLIAATAAGHALRSGPPPPKRWQGSVAKKLGR